MQVIQLTKEVLAEAAQQDASASTASAPAVLPGPVAAITTAPEVRVPSVLPPQVAQQIRFAQQRAALAGQAPPAWAIGAQVQAVYSGDGQWCVAQLDLHLLHACKLWTARHECQVCPFYSSSFLAQVRLRGQRDQCWRQLHRAV